VAAVDCGCVPVVDGAGGVVVVGAPVVVALPVVVEATGGVGGGNAVVVGAGRVVGLTVLLVAGGATDRCDGPQAVSPAVRAMVVATVAARWAL
jgi:hypothetical protein